MTEHDDNRVHYLLDACEVRGHLNIKPDVHRKRAEEEERMKLQMDEWAYQDWCDAEFMARHE